MKIVVTGSTGQLGSELRDVVGQYPQFEFVFHDRTTLPLDKLKELKDVLEIEKPKYIINAAAYTAVDKAESDVEQADLINHLAIEAMGQWAMENNAKLIHISTDYVFDGNSTVALEEEAVTNPINQYGLTKRKGEEALLGMNSDAVIIRTAWVYSTYGANFVKTMCRLMKEREEIGVVGDQIGSPTYAKDLAIAIMNIIASSLWEKGIYHFSNEGEISWYEFAVKIKDLQGYHCKVNRITSLDFPTPAKRPQYSLLNKKKIINTYQVSVPHWEKSLVEMLNKLKS